MGVGWVSYRCEGYAWIVRGVDVGRGTQGRMRVCSSGFMFMEVEVGEGVEVPMGWASMLVSADVYILPDKNSD